MNTSRAYKFVVVDDDITFLKLMTRLLEASGNDVVMYHAGTTAVIDIPEEQPDCVITDLEMVGMNGIQLVRELRTEPALAETRIVMITGSADEEDEQAARAAGIDGFIRKPVEPAKIVSQVMAMIGAAG